MGCRHRHWVCNAPASGFTVQLETSSYLPHIEHTTHKTHARFSWAFPAAFVCVCYPLFRHILYFLFIRKGEIFITGSSPSNKSQWLSRFDENVWKTWNFTKQIIHRHRWIHRQAPNSVQNLSWLPFPRHRSCQLSVIHITSLITGVTTPYYWRRR